MQRRADFIPRSSRVRAGLSACTSLRIHAYKYVAPVPGCSRTNAVHNMTSPTVEESSLLLSHLLMPVRRRCVHLCHRRVVPVESMSHRRAKVSRWHVNPSQLCALMGFDAVPGSSSQHSFPSLFHVGVQTGARRRRTVCTLACALV